MWLKAFNGPLLYKFDVRAERIKRTLSLSDRRSLVAVAGLHVWIATPGGGLRRLR